MIVALNQQDNDCDLWRLDAGSLFGPSLNHLFSLLDDVGIAQHATYSVVAREHGYCLDDNARGMLLAVTLGRRRLHLTAARHLFDRTAAFVQHAWNPDTQRFRNFMSYQRTWLELSGSEDSHGRAVWALGVVCRDSDRSSDQDWAMEMLERAAPSITGFSSPRALAYALIGIVAALDSGREGCLHLLKQTIAARLMGHLRDCCRADWIWFEASLTYDNARLAESLIRAGRPSRHGDETQTPIWLKAGLDTLAWLCRIQTAPNGYFRPVGSQRPWMQGEPFPCFDQQPLEAAATASAARSAFESTGCNEWLIEVDRAHRWFQGENDLRLPLVVTGTGGCRDGLHSTRVNANQGAESTLSWLQTVYEHGEAAPS